MIQYKIGDIHDVIKTIDDNSIDLIYTDPPFNITKASWENPLDWKLLFSEMWRVIKPTWKIILYSSILHDFLQNRYDTSYLK